MKMTSALHTAVRRFCMEEHAIWVQEYSDLQSAEGFRVQDYFRPGWTYSQGAYSLFPRYRLAEGTLINVERISLESGTSLEQVRILLLKAGQDAYDHLREEFKGKDAACAALTSQAAAYQDFVVNISPTLLESVEPLPYRRVLTDQESAALWQILRATWQIRGAGYGRFPLTDDVPPPGALTFHDELWRARGGRALLQEFLLLKRPSIAFSCANLGRLNLNWTRV